MNEKHKYFMREALKEAQKAYEEDEVPVGAVLVYQDKIIARAYNQRENKQSSLAHAEVLVIEKASAILKKWRLDETTLYISLEPCLMCAGSIAEARIKKVVYGATDLKAGFFDSKMNIQDYYKDIEIIRGVLADESRRLLQEYFKVKRNKNLKVRRIHEHEFHAYLSLRTEIFVDEQKVPEELEFDAFDQAHNVWHIGGFFENKIVASMRLIFKDNKVLTLGRLAVKKDYRNQGIASQMLNYAVKQAYHQGYKILELSAQIQAQSFYENNGFLAVGKTYLDAGIEHIKMVKEIKRA